MLRTYERYSRRICWPNPDLVCVEGGCIHCNDHEWRKVSEIRAYAHDPGHWGPLRAALDEAFEFGAAHNFYNAQFRDDTTGALIP